jgi:hypothetical protein
MSRRALMRAKNLKHLAVKISMHDLQASKDGSCSVSIYHRDHDFVEPMHPNLYTFLFSYFMSKTSGFFFARISGQML